jgi:hypothetical protein
VRVCIIMKGNYPMLGHGTDLHGMGHDSLFGLDDWLFVSPVLVQTPRSAHRLLLHRPTVTSFHCFSHCEKPQKYTKRTMLEKFRILDILRNF